MRGSTGVEPFAEQRGATSRFFRQLPVCPDAVGELQRDGIAVCALPKDAGNSRHLDIDIITRCPGQRPEV